MPRLNSGIFFMAQRCELFVNSQFLGVLQVESPTRRGIKGLVIPSSMAVREFVVEFTLHSSFSFYIAIATMPFDSDIYLNDFVF